MVYAYMGYIVGKIMLQVHAISFIFIYLTHMYCICINIQIYICSVSVWFC
jgi:hypothetical protein